MNNKETIKKKSVRISKPLKLLAPTEIKELKGIDLLKHRKNLLKKVTKRMISKYDFSIKSFYIMKITQILDYKTIASKKYKEFLILIDTKEFLNKYYTSRLQRIQCDILIHIVSQLVKFYPNYCPLRDLYPLMQSYLCQKQNLININYELLINKLNRRYPNTNIDAILESEIFNESNSFDDDEIYNPIFFNNINQKKEDSIISVENLVKYIDHVENGYDQLNNGLLMTPKIKKKKSRRINTMYSVLKQINYLNLNDDRDKINNNLNDKIGGNNCDKNIQFKFLHIKNWKLSNQYKTLNECKELDENQNFIILNTLKSTKNKLNEEGNNNNINFHKKFDFTNLIIKEDEKENKENNRFNKRKSAAFNCIPYNELLLMKNNINSTKSNCINNNINGRNSMLSLSSTKNKNSKELNIIKSPKFNLNFNKIYNSNSIQSKTNNTNNFTNNLIIDNIKIINSNRSNNKETFDKILGSARSYKTATFRNNENHPFLQKCSCSNSCRYLNQKRKKEKNLFSSNKKKANHRNINSSHQRKILNLLNDFNNNNNLNSKCSPINNNDNKLNNNIQILDSFRKMIDGDNKVNDKEDNNEKKIDIEEDEDKNTMFDYNNIKSKKFVDSIAFLAKKEEMVIKNNDFENTLNSLKNNFISFQLSQLKNKENKNRKKIKKINKKIIQNVRGINQKNKISNNFSNIDINYSDSKNFHTITHFQINSKILKFNKSINKDQDTQVTKSERSKNYSKIKQKKINKKIPRNKKEFDKTYEKLTLMSENSNKISHHKYLSYFNNKKNDYYNNCINNCISLESQRKNPNFPIINQNKPIYTKLENYKNVNLCRDLNNKKTYIKRNNELSKTVSNLNSKQKFQIISLKNKNLESSLNATNQSSALLYIQNLKGIVKKNLNNKKKVNVSNLINTELYNQNHKKYFSISSRNYTNYDYILQNTENKNDNCLKNENNETEVDNEFENVNYKICQKSINSESNFNIKLQPKYL